MSERNKKNKFTGVSNRIGGKSKMETPAAFKTLLKQRGYSNRAVEEIWKWYDFSKRRKSIPKNRHALSVHDAT